MSVKSTLRRVGAAVVCAAMALSITAYAASNQSSLPIQKFPCSTTAEFTQLFLKQREKTPDKIYYHPYTGLFQEDVKVEGQEGRVLYTYIADETPHCASSVFVAIPSGTRPERFLVSSGWVELADKYKFLLHALTPNGSDWADQDSELAYLTAAFAMGSRTINYSPYTGNYYFVGYGIGGRLLEQYVMANPDNCSGLAVVSGGGVDQAYLDKMAETPAIAVDKTVSQVNVPVWIIERKLDNKLQATIDYWRNANQWDGKTAYVDANISKETTIYPQNMLSNDAFINAYPLGKVLVTLDSVSYGDKAFNRTIWENFLCKVQRYNSLAGKDLRPAVDFDALGFTKEERTIDGYSRYWLEYVPQSVKDSPDKKVPMVIALHGAGQCAEAYAPYSEWFKVAEEAGFIVVFPTAYPFSENNGMARPIHNDCWQEDRPSDISYWRQIIQDVSKRFPVDASRVYATGHSNGGNSSAMIAGEMSDVIAAVAISAGRYRNVNNPVTDDVATLHEMASTYKVPVIQLVGTNDGGAYRSPSLTSTMMYWLQRNECQDLANPLTYKTAGYHHQIWRDADGVPMVRFAVIENKPHTTTPSESRLFWYEFLCHYSRGADGSVQYMQDPDIIRN